MKFLLFILSFLLIISCAKIQKTEAIIIRDCTGVYLRFNNLDHPVCNLSDLSGFKSGTEVLVSYSKEPKNCEAKSYPVCCVIHDYPYGEWIKLTDIQIK